MKTVIITKLQASQIIGAAFPIAEAARAWKAFSSRPINIFVGSSMLSTDGKEGFALSGDQDDIDYWMGFTFEPIVGGVLS